MRWMIPIVLAALAGVAVAQDAAPEGVDPVPPPELPERTSRPVPPGHPIIADYGGMLERLSEATDPARPEELLVRLAGDYRFESEINVATDAHVRAIAGLATGEPVLDGRGLRLSLAGEIEIGPTRMPYASEALLLFDHDTMEYVCFQRDTLGGQVSELRGTANDDETEITLAAPGNGGDLVQVIAFDERGLTEIRGYLRPAGMLDYAHRSRTAFTARENPADQPRYLVIYEPAWEGAADGAPLPEHQRTVYARHLRHLRSLANSGLLERSGVVGEGELIALLRGPDEAGVRHAAEANPAVEAGLFTVTVRPYRPLYDDPRGG